MSLFLQSPSLFSETIIQWQASQGRHSLPWQQNPSPYRVLVSEMMLQQTQVSTVIPYFERWMAAFPDVADLAQAETDQVMALWQGLGYYARARNLHKAAKTIAGLGDFPFELADLLAIPGIGRYTAGAIRSFAYDSWGPIVDGNVRRLFCRLFAIEGVPTSSAVDKKLWTLAEQLTPLKQNRSFAQALLDLGATICKPRQPLCERCPLQADCLAYQQNRVAELPTAKPKKQTPVKQGHFLWVQQQGLLLLEKRPSTGIWADLWALPQVETEPKAVLQGEFNHVFSHYKLQAKVWQLEVAETKPEQSWYSRKQLESVGLPAPIRSWIKARLQDETD
ncbi:MULTISPECIES: A/G-specific adenine glycosylase [Rheinheimera]|uniref:Adenine DNA glycosylase n=1 Tax=Rheinheimera marina TaxID=1774958 RepID=A0ABV9JKX9_9GAMM